MSLLRTKCYIGVLDSHWKKQTLLLASESLNTTVKLYLVKQGRIYEPENLEELVFS